MAEGDGGEMSRGMRIEFRFVPFPQEIWSGKGIDLTEAEFKVLGYLLYHQARFGQAIICLTDEEMLNGKRLNDGRRGDAGCGVKGRNNFKAAREKLIAREWIEFEPGHGYRVLLSTIYQQVSETDTRLSESDTEDIRSGQAIRPNQTPKVSETDTPNKEEKKELEGTKKTPKAQAPFVLPDWIPQESWDGFEEMRKKIRKPMTDRARGMVITELFKLKNRGHPAGEVLDQSTRNCWQDVYELKEKRSNDSGNGNHKSAAAGRQSRNIEALVRSSVGAGVQRSDVSDGGAVRPGAAGGAADQGESSIAVGEVLAREPDRP
ncbi:MAG TPA: hypothetical protein VKW06_00355 [Candidatus Angelobacter sp.]|nr:hypothetical protein [Candidatus Angelobacter sp.]